MECSRVCVAVIFVLVFGTGLCCCAICDYLRLSTGKYANCSSRNLSTIPENIASDTTILDLSNNSIRTVPNNIFEELVCLEELFLNKNSITVLDKNAFFGLRKLQVLNLNENNINSTYLDEAIGQCLNLEELSISGLYNKTFGPGYSKLTKLTKLILSSNDCNITALQNNTFNNTPHVQELQLHNCHISFIDACTFCSLRKLAVLDLSNNSPDGLKLLRNVTYGLQHSNITNVTFSNMEDPHGIGKMITKRDLEFSKNTSIKNLDVSGNMIELLESGSFPLFPPDLEIIDVSDNRPTVGLYLIEISSLKKLRVVRANYLNAYHDFVFPFRTYSESSLKHDISNYSQYKRGCINIPPKLEELYSCHSMIPFDIPEISVCSDNSLRHVKLNHNALTGWSGPVRTFDKLEYLDLSVNLCEKISENFFINLTSLTTLSVKANFIGYVIEKNTTTCPWLKPLKNLRTLNLFRNKIRILPSECFSTLINLETLNLSDNALSDWEIDIKHMPNISVLDLKDNSIDGLPKDTRNHLSEVAKRRNVSINLKRNKLECTCENIEFLEWIDTANIHFVGRKEYTCKTKQWKETNMTNLKEIISKLKLECADYTYLNTVLSVVIGCFILVILYGMYARYRWKISYIYYMTWGRYQMLEEGDEGKYTYDAFISYAEDDTSFVEGELALKLEGLHHLSLYLFWRDCKPGKHIQATIVEKMGNCRKIILIFTESYIKNPRCMFELNMANITKQNRKGVKQPVLLVKLYSVPHKDIPTEILQIFQSDCYIEYPKDPQGNITFWERLKNTIKPNETPLS